MALNVGFGNAAPAPVALPAKKLEVKPSTAQPSAVTDKSQPKKDEVSFSTKAGNFAKSPVGIGTGLLALAGVAYLGYKAITGKSDPAKVLEKAKTAYKEFVKNNAAALPEARKALVANGNELTKLPETQQTLLKEATKLKSELRTAKDAVSSNEFKAVRDARLNQFKAYLAQKNVTAETTDEAKKALTDAYTAAKTKVTEAKGNAEYIAQVKARKDARVAKVAVEPTKVEEPKPNETPAA